ncbi:MAG: heat-inducible transcription repressor HrcA [Candidatus Omnitrophica bacterium CG22_combo_CG10-13_8_21_14_all_43_16]|nr:MAG: heat-inducible transcription repressor HrcA [Candidatus Omnitrophica bacterium CG22_combo_CG10-13_8_21_14_all_43_16]
MKKVDIESRQKSILNAIVDSYVDTATPVGSRSIAQRFRNTISPATIRNVMVDLEEMGLIMQPHTSAGRVPTDRGYRFYVDSLLEPKHLTKEEETIINKLIHSSGSDIEYAMQNASKAISIVTNVAGLVLTPRLKRSIFKHIELFNIDDSRILAVIITTSGFVKNSIMDFEEHLTRQELTRITEFLNSELEGVSLGDIKSYLTRKLLEERDSFYTFLKRAADILSIPGLFKTDDHLYFDGAACIMSHPEFTDIKKARLFLRACEDKKGLLNLLNQDMELEGVKIHIGKENICNEIQELSIVTCNYKVNDMTVGAIAAIGPTRMEYGKIISVLEYISNELGKEMESLG